MKNVTISMNDDLLAWVRVEAAKAGQSTSRWVAQALDDRRAGRPSDREIEETLRMMDEFLAMPTAPISENGKAFDREEIYNERFRRFDDPHLSDGQEGRSEEGQLRRVAEGGRAFKGAGPDATGSE